MKKLLFTLAVISLASCRKDVTLELPEYQDKIVVEGSIEPGMPAIVFLSYGVPYFGDFDFSTPEKAFVKEAVVELSDGTKTETLIQLDPRYGYIFAGTKIFGQVGKTYTLKITDKGKSYECSSTLLPARKLDSLYFKVDHDSLGFMWQKFNEPAGLGDCYRWFSKRLYRDAVFAAPFNSVFTDKFVDGKVFHFGYNRGAPPNRLQENREDPERGYYKRGDTVVVKFCTIGQAEYDFWRTYYRNRSSNSNPFSSPVNVKSMFVDYEHVFGAFVAYSASYDTLIIPEK